MSGGAAELRGSKSAGDIIKTRRADKIEALNFWPEWVLAANRPTAEAAGWLFKRKCPAGKAMPKIVVAEFLGLPDGEVRTFRDRLELLGCLPVRHRKQLLELTSGESEAL